MKQLCQRNDCTTYATYNFPGMSKRRFCGRHALTGMVNVKQKPKPNLGPRQSQSSLENACIYGTCQDTAVYGWRDNPTKVFCIAHTLPGMVVDAEPLDPGQDCLYDGCSNTASCSYKGPKSSLRPRFCDMHKRPGMSLTKTHFDQPMTKQETSCIYGECHELAAFNFRTLPARFCGLHISDGMVGATDSSADTTTHEQDKMAPDKVQQPKLGAETQKPDSASENSKPQIQEKTSPTPTVSTGLAEKSRPTASSQSTHIFCVREGCDLTASYGTSGEAKPQFCSLHSRPGMRLLTVSAIAPTTGASGILKKWGATVPSLTKSRCEKAGCLRWATCGLAGTDVARFCPDHKQLHMVAVVGAQPGRKRCRVKGCVGLAEWGEPRTNNALVCQVHKNDGMVMINTRWFCRAKGCTKYASYNVPGKRRAFCLEHRSEDMVDVRKLPLCHQSPCPRFATCNFSGAAKLRKRLKEFFKDQPKHSCIDNFYHERLELNRRTQEAKSSNEFAVIIAKFETLVLEKVKSKLWLGDDYIIQLRDQGFLMGMTRDEWLEKLFSVEADLDHLEACIEDFSHYCTSPDFVSNTDKAKQNTNARDLAQATLRRLKMSQVTRLSQPPSDLSNSSVLQDVPSVAVENGIRVQQQDGWLNTATSTKSDFEGAALQQYGQGIGLATSSYGMSYHPNSTCQIPATTNNRSDQEDVSIRQPKAGRIDKPSTARSSGAKMSMRGQLLHQNTFQPQEQGPAVDHHQGIVPGQQEAVCGTIIDVSNTDQDDTNNVSHNTFLSNKQQGKQQQQQHKENNWHLEQEIQYCVPDIAVPSNVCPKKDGRECVLDQSPIEFKNVKRKSAPENDPVLITAEQDHTKVIDSRPKKAKTTAKLLAALEAYSIDL